MAADRSGRRMPLRDMLIHSEKNARDLAEQLQSTFLNQLTDFRKLSRPNRQTSHFPTFRAMRNALKKLHEAGEEARGQVERLQQMLKDIRELAQRERKRGL